MTFLLARVYFCRGHLAAAYKRYQLDLQQAGQPSSDLLMLEVRSRIPNIKAYERLVTSLFLDPTVGSVKCMDAPNLLGEIDPRLYALSILFLSVTAKRQPCDSLIALCVSTTAETDFIGTKLN